MSTAWIPQDEGDRLVRVVIRRYKNRGATYAYSLEDDLLQEGRLALLRAERTFNPAFGTTPVQYAWRALVLWMGTYLSRMSSPASGDAAKKGRPNQGIRTDYEATAEAWTDTLPEGGTFHTAGAESAFFACEWNAEVRARLSSLAGRDKVAVSVALDLEPAAEVAKRTGRKLGEVYRAVRRLRARAAQDVLLWQLLQAKQGSQ